MNYYQDIFETRSPQAQKNIESDRSIFILSHVWRIKIGLFTGYAYETVKFSPYKVYQSGVSRLLLCDSYGTHTKLYCLTT